MGYVYIILTLLFTVYGQLVLKWQIGKAGSLPTGIFAKIAFLLHQFMNPWILSGFFSAFLASLCWMATMTIMEINCAYPFMSLAFLLVMGFSVVFLNETLSWSRVTGTSLVIFGLIIISR